MSRYFERIESEWRSRSRELAAWAMTNLVNRTDVWGRYVASRSDSSEVHAVTAPFREERGKVFLDIESLEKHFKAARGNGLLGVHSTSADQTSRWLAIDIDLHDPEELSVTAAGNFSAAKAWHQSLVEVGLDPLLLDSNGQGGYHLLVVFAEPLSAASVHAFGKQLVADYLKRGLDQLPEIFPGTPRWDHYGDWLRLPGRHHNHEHYTRVFNDEPWAEQQWLEGSEAIDRILAHRPASIEIALRLAMVRSQRTVCLDFDGVLHSYRSGWCGAEVIPDPPIHGTKEAVARLRQSFRVVVHSSRCHTPQGRLAVEQWLKRHNIDVDEVCTHKPPAMVYLDDRAVRFQGDWDQAITEIHEFRR